MSKSNATFVVSLSFLSDSFKLYEIVRAEISFFRLVLHQGYWRANQGAVPVLPFFLRRAIVPNSLQGVRRFLTHRSFPSVAKFSGSVLMFVAALTWFTMGTPMLFDRQVPAGSPQFAQPHFSFMQPPVFTPNFPSHLP